jgi:hypothetical protein
MLPDNFRDSKSRQKALPNPDTMEGEFEGYEDEEDEEEE